MDAPRRAGRFTAFLLLALAGCEAGGMVFEWKPDGGEDDEEPSASLRKATRREERTLAVSSGEVVFLDGRAGDVVVDVSTDGTASLSAGITACGKTRAEAEARAQAVRVVVERDGNGVRVAPESPAPLEKDKREKGKVHHVWERIDWQVRIPAGVSVTVRNGFGDVRCEGIRGDVSVEAGSGSVRIRDVEGKAVSAVSFFGGIEIASVKAERVSVKSSSGKLLAERVSAGRIELSSSFGECRLKEVSGTCAVRLASGRIAAEGISGSLDGETHSGDIEASGLFDTLALRTDSGSIRASCARAPAVPWMLVTSFGDVFLKLPAGASMSLSARTDFGRIETGFRVTMEPGEVAPGKGLSGKIGTGGPLVTLRTASGSIRLEAGE